jgi:formate--tetrahydrofolate ligase
MLSDIEIAQKSKLLPIETIAQRAGLRIGEYERWGGHKAKVKLSVMERIGKNPRGKLILVTTTSPTPAGEGKTTMTIGLAQALAKQGHRAMLGIREPSLGPVFGIKGGAAGGGYSQVLPMEEINLHFTGDLHAISSAHNLLAALLNNHMHHGNELCIEPRRISWHRVMDMNDRSLRNIVIGLGGTRNGVPQEDNFDITAASEVMAVLCLSRDMDDLKRKLSEIVVARDRDKKIIKAGDLGAVGAMALLLKEAIKPNLVQTIEGVPAFVHGGPFANIAHGTSSYISTLMGLHLSEYFVTEAGFGADLGAEKFFDIFCRKTGITPSVVVMVVTVRSLKMNGGVPKDRLESENIEALRAGADNLKRHLGIIDLYGLPVVVGINRFVTDTQAEIDELLGICSDMGVPAAVSEHHEKGGEGALDVADLIKEAMDRRESRFKLLYEDEMTIEDKIEIICGKVYGASKVDYAIEAVKSIKRYEEHGYGNLPICMAKTQYSFSDNRKLLGAPSDFKITISDVRLSAGAGFIIPLTGDITTMPGLPSRPAAMDMDLIDGKAVGLF